MVRNIGLNMAGMCCGKKTGKDQGQKASFSISFSEFLERVMVRKVRFKFQQTLKMEQIFGKKRVRIQKKSS
jgi:hypothetical protein